MPLSVVVGGQFGSEGKGKIALEVTRRTQAAAVVRVGGSNSGHTVASRDGKILAFRQLPAAVVDGNAIAVLPPGSYLDVEVLLSEIRTLKLDADRVAIDPYAHIISAEHKQWEQTSGLGRKIGSTQSGTGAAVAAAVARGSAQLDLPLQFAKDISALTTYIRDTSELLRSLLKQGERVVIEGTQGFGLSLLHSGLWPKVTSRDTTAAAFVSEAGLSPLDVDDVTLVIRSFPIRVSGNSGPLAKETDWSEVAAVTGVERDLSELSTVTKKVRRVAFFDPGVVRRAIAANAPTRLAMNHVDYIEQIDGATNIGEKADAFIQSVEKMIDRRIDWIGLGPSIVVDRQQSPLSSTLLRKGRGVWI